MNKGFRPLLQFTDEEITQVDRISKQSVFLLNRVVSTN